MSSQPQRAQQVGAHVDAGAAADPMPRWLLPALGAVPIVAILAILIYSVDDWDMVAVAGLVAAGSLVAGGLLGFLFGIPRSLTGDDRARQDSSTVRPNTNLEQISDWLTKILVGVGLVQFTTLAQHVGDLVAFLGPAFGEGVRGETFAGATLTVFAISGFLLFYLVTRIYLPRAFASADRLTLRDVMNHVDRREHEKDVADVDALNLVRRQLDPEPGAPEIKQPELNAAVSAASLFTRTHIFYLARNRRRETWNTDKSKMERTIPIFRALIAAETPDHQYHRNRGQLGYALKDMQNPDYPSADTQLTDAIKIRDEAGEGGYLLYEFNRALARIAIHGMNPSPEIRQAIEADLAAAAANRTLKKLIDDVTLITDFRDAAPR